MATSTARVCVTDAKGGTDECRHDVLFVDLDPRGNAAEGVCRLDEPVVDQTDGLEGRTGTTVDTLGVVASRAEASGEDETTVEWSEAVLADDPVWQVRERVGLQRAFSAGGSVFGYDPSVDAAGVFPAVAAELDEQLGCANTEVTA